ncbi:nitroreductase family protein [Sporomusa malonica]|uniref:Nitroreductase n=1 Tax=Sporomusa malonica TaxID=112901 RepID=A0A1W1ZAQ1_9FIRM|nr:nitroreductase family protein [Sporomusa malonica]SMC45386.1 Nitroreductase [Sporomusa malonica]
MDLITVNQEECTKCGICARECPTIVLSMGENGPEAVAPLACIACGHCVAVCPNEAIDNIKTPLARQLDLTAFPKLSAEEAERFLRSRRSIRCYKKTTVPREDLLKLVEVARFAPTASNMQGVSYVIVDDQKTLQESIELAIKWLENDALLCDRFANYIKAYREDGIDIVLRGAPNLILATAATDFSRGRENSVFSLAYLELYAPNLGLGSCWAGILEVCALSANSPMLKLFNIPEGKKITGAVMVGYPQYSYKRIVDRDPLNVTFYKREI